MTRKLFLITGPHKTGTTSIQKACRANNNILFQSRYYYPLINFKDIQTNYFENHTRLIQRIFRKESGRIIERSGEVPLELRRNIREKFKKALENRNDHLIICAEYISLLERMELKDLNNFFTEIGFAINSIFVIRNPLLWLNSMIAQRTSGKFELVVTLPESIMEFKSRGAIYRDRIENIKSTLPNTSFVSFNELIQNRRGPAGWFLEKIGVNAIVSDIKTNESISDHSVRLASKINQNAFASGLNWQFYNTRIKKFPALTQIPGEKFYLREFEITPLKHILIEENEWLKDTFGKDFYDDEINFKNEPVTLNNEQRQFMIDHLSSIPEPIIQFAVKDYLNKH